MDDPRLMRGIERLRDLSRDGKRFVHGHRPTRHQIRERDAVDELQDQGMRIAGLLQPIDGGDVRMVQRGEHLGLALEAAQAVRIEGEQLGQHLQRDITIQPGIARAIDLAHAADANGHDDFILTEPAPGRQRHLCELAAIISTLPGFVVQAKRKDFEEIGATPQQVDDAR
jgi:hypothetical protein